MCCFIWRHRRQLAYTKDDINMADNSTVPWLRFHPEGSAGMFHYLSCSNSFLDGAFKSDMSNAGFTSTMSE